MHPDNRVILRNDRGNVRLVDRNYTATDKDRHNFSRSFTLVRIIVLYSCVVEGGTLMWLAYATRY